MKEFCEAVLLWSGDIISKLWNNTGTQSCSMEMGLCTHCQVLLSICVQVALCAARDLLSQKQHLQRLKKGLGTVDPRSNLHTHDSSGHENVCDYPKHHTWFTMHMLLSSVFCHQFFCFLSVSTGSSILNPHTWRQKLLAEALIRNLGSLKDHILFKLPDALRGSLEALCDYHSSPEWMQENSIAHPDLLIATSCRHWNLPWWL